MKGLWLHQRTGKPYYRTRRGGKTVLTALPDDLPFDHPDFVAAWATAARTGKATPKPAAGTLASTWAAFSASDAFHEWTPVYQAKIVRQFTAICATKGHVAARVIQSNSVAESVGVMVKAP